MERDPICFHRQGVDGLLFRAGYPLTTGEEVTVKQGDTENGLIRTGVMKFRAKKRAQRGDSYEGKDALFPEEN